MKGCQSEGSLAVGLQELVEGLCVEFVVAEVQGGVDGLEGLEVNVELLLLAIICHHCACVDDQPIGWHLQAMRQFMLPSNSFKR